MVLSVSLTFINSYKRAEGSDLWEFLWAETNELHNILDISSTNNLFMKLKTVWTYSILWQFKTQDWISASCPQPPSLKKPPNHSTHYITPRLLCLLFSNPLVWDRAFCSPFSQYFWEEGGWLTCFPHLPFEPASLSQSTWGIFSRKATYQLTPVSSARAGKKLLPVLPQLSH